MDKRISFFWGNEKMSWLRYMTLYSFRQLNPDWEIRLFMCNQQRFDKYWDTPELQDFFAYHGPDYCDLLEGIEGLKVIVWEIDEPDLISLGPSHKSNFFKWDLMDKESGVYADMDILFVRPIDDWFNHVQGSDVGICYQKTSLPHHFSIGLLSSSGRGSFYKAVYDECVRGCTEDKYQSAGVKTLFRILKGIKTGKHLDALRKRYPDTSFVNFEMDYVYPWDCTEIPEMTTKLHTEIPERTFGIHWYAGHETSQRLNATLIPETLSDHQNTIAHYARQLWPFPHENATKE